MAIKAPNFLDPELKLNDIQSAKGLISKVGLRQWPAAFKASAIGLFLSIALRFGIVPIPDDSQWQRPKWARVDKHHSRGNETWDELLSKSSGRTGNGVYRINPDEVSRLEIAAVSNPKQEILPRKNELHERHYWGMSSQDIGASKGNCTRYFYVIYHIDGTVHGYPITLELLRDKGANI